MTLPQIRAMYNGDRARKQVLVEYGFRLPSALDNRPLNFGEFEQAVNQAIYVSATPGPYEYEQSQQMVEQVIRPTGLTDPAIEVKPTDGQIDDLLHQIQLTVKSGERCIVTTLTKRMAEELADFLREMGVRTHYLQLRDRHARTQRDTPRPAPRRLRRHRRHKPAPRGPRPPRSQPGRHSRRRQRRLPALHNVARPDHRTRRQARRRTRHHVRRPASPTP